jgi:hypothetical protein
MILAREPGATFAKLLITISVEFDSVSLIMPKLWYYVLSWIQLNQIIGMMAGCVSSDGYGLGLLLHDGYS